MRFGSRMYEMSASYESRCMKSPNAPSPPVKHSSGLKSQSRSNSCTPVTCSSPLETVSRNVCYCPDCDALPFTPESNRNQSFGCSSYSPSASTSGTPNVKSPYTNVVTSTMVGCISDSPSRAICRRAIASSSSPVSGCATKVVVPIKKRRMSENVDLSHQHDLNDVFSQQTVNYETKVKSATEISPRMKSSTTNGRNSSPGSGQKVPKSKIPQACKKRITSPHTNKNKSEMQSSSVTGCGDKLGKEGVCQSHCASWALQVAHGNGFPPTMRNGGTLEMCQFNGCFHRPRTGRLSSDSAASCPVSFVDMELEPWDSKGIQSPVIAGIMLEDDTKSGEGTTLAVAVRVRPFNQRERRGCTKCVVSLSGQELLIHHPQTNQTLSFMFDICFWSFNLQDEDYAGQEEVYRRLGQPMLDKVFQGYNTCLFAYGQTGSGKSYTMMGYNEDVGIIPRFCEELFQKAAEHSQQNIICHIEMSYFEVYNEKIHDLLTSPKVKEQKKVALRVREHPDLGPYVTGLSSFITPGAKTRGGNIKNGLKDFETKLLKREVLDGEAHEHAVTSHVNMVDLAGNERCSAAETSEKRLKEGASINKSLLTLGKVISALSELSQSKKKVFIPYRDSVLTWLLKESLGGNSMTTMIATISPAVVNLEETLSTLRYATQARSIINVAKVNEDSNARLIRELKSEIEKLRLQQCSQGLNIIQYELSLQEIQSLKLKLAEKDKEMAEAQKEWKEKLILAEQCKMEEAKELQKSGVAFKVENHLPNLVNLNEDPQLSETLLYLIKEGLTKVGKLQANSTHEIQLSGALIADDHCDILNEHGVVQLIPSAEGKSFVNGNLIEQPVILHHGDRVILGGGHYFRFNHPVEVQNGCRSSVVGVEWTKDFEFAKNELIEAQKQKIDAEIEEARLQGQKEMLNELQMAKELAQQELSAQKLMYENHIKELESQLEAYKKIDLVFGEHEEGSQSNTKKAGVSAQPLPLSQDLDQIGVKSMKFIEALGREKQRLAQETEQLRQTHKTKEKLQKQASAEGHAQIKAFRLSLLLQEANSISRSLKKHTMFTRYEAPAIMDEPPILYVQVTNMKLGIFTLWSPEKFEEKLISMRELYQGTSDDNGDVFFDPSDKWEADVRSPSPTKRSRYSLSRQKSGQFLRKVSGEAIPALDNTSCLSACKQWVSLAVEDLDKKLLSSNLIDLILACLQLVMDSSKELAEVYNADKSMDESGCLVPCNAQTQSLCFKSSSAVDNLILAVKHLQSCIPESNSLATCLDNLVTEVKMLGRNFVFLLHGCECAINSVITESRDKIDQSVLSITKQLGQLAVAMGSEMKILTTEQCSLQQAEIVHNPMKESFLSGAEMHISDQIDAGICSIGGLANFLQNLEPENKLAHVVKQKLTSIGSDLQYVMQKSKAVWNNFVSANGTRKDISNICLQEHIASCKTLNTDLGSLEDAWKSTCNAVLQCIRGNIWTFVLILCYTP
ncbi:kinesin-like protein KIF14 [Protopterus annectens]|uniref:kinesin-like protein KIF14 n=1 Tax=Protopterus annectens TaxID=7888 RepID=UPI001CFBBE95|nr:kinesin-like protein KIF14 [Protopterus annectens]